MTCCVAGGVEDVETSVTEVVVGSEWTEFQGCWVVWGEGDFAEFAVGEVDVAGFDLGVFAGWVAGVDIWVAFEAWADDEGRG